MSLAKDISEISGIVMAMVMAFIFLGIGIHIIQYIGSQANIAILSDLSSNLGSWGTTWFPIILVVAAASVTLGIFLRGLRKR